jgi:hypothetical protein
MDTHSSVKLQKFVMPDGRVAEITSAKDYKFLLAYESGNHWNTISLNVTKRGVEERLAYYEKIWRGKNTHFEIIRRTSKEFINREQ